MPTPTDTHHFGRAKGESPSINHPPIPSSSFYFCSLYIALDYIARTDTFLIISYHPLKSVTFYSNNCLKSSRLTYHVYCFPNSYNLQSFLLPDMSAVTPMSHILEPLGVSNLDCQAYKGMSISFLYYPSIQKIKLVCMTCL